LCPGYESLLNGVYSAISTVNLAEVVSRLAAVGMPADEIKNILTLLGLEIVSFEKEQAFEAGFLFPSTRSLGFSLGDRACLELAKVTSATVVTADQAWGNLDPEIEIKLVR
jgi:ribonuclease VapC